VLFSAERVRAKGSNFLTNVRPTPKFVKVDDYTVDVQLDAPNPILMFAMGGWYIMDKKWCEKNNSVAPTPAPQPRPATPRLHEKRHRSLHDRKPSAGVKTVFKVNPIGGINPNTISRKSSSRRSDRRQHGSQLCCRAKSTFIEPVPIQDIQGSMRAGTVTVMSGPEIRTLSPAWTRSAMNS